MGQYPDFVSRSEGEFFQETADFASRVFETCGCACADVAKAPTFDCTVVASSESVHQTRQHVPGTCADKTCP
jgi:hypothetical protein